MTSNHENPLRIGVLALQGDFREHVHALRRLDEVGELEIVEVRLPAQLEGLDGIIIPGGESMTISKLMQDYGLLTPVKAFAKAGKCVWGTCAGMIVIAKETTDLAPWKPLGLVDISVRRNAYGRQVDSFEEEVSIPALEGNQSFHCIFIRAPGISKMGKKVEILAQLPDGTPIAARQNQILVTAFHPELTQDTRFHAFFLHMAEKGRENEQDRA